LNVLSCLDGERNYRENEREGGKMRGDVRLEWKGGEGNGRGKRKEDKRSREKVTIGTEKGRR
jgi:hypothetical protein